MKVIFFLSTSLFVVGCSTSSKSVDVNGPVTLRLKGEQGQTDITRYYSHAKINAFAEDQKVKERDEIVDFSVSEKTKAVDEKNKRLTVVSSTIRKDGTVDLHDLAFPELNEEIEYVFDDLAKVFKAGPYPPESVFFVPPLPLPEEAVEVGSTWNMDHAWIGLKNGIPLQLQIIGILKGFGRCGSKDRCADIEISGNVDVIGIKKAAVEYRSEVWGRLLFSLDRGAVVWSEVRNKEMMRTPEESLEILACMASVLEEPRGLLPKSGLKAFCVPNDEPVSSPL